MKSGERFSLNSILYVISIIESDDNLILIFWWSFQKYDWKRIDLLKKQIYLRLFITIFMW